MTTMRGTLDNHHTVVYCPRCDWRGILGASDAMDVLDPDGVKIDETSVCPKCATEVRPLPLSEADCRTIDADMAASVDHTPADPELLP